MEYEPMGMEELGRRVARTIGDGPPLGERQGLKDLALSRAIVRTKERRLQRLRRGFALAASIAVIAATSLMYFSSSRAVSYWVGNEIEPSKPGRWISAGDALPLGVRFENGSHLELGQGATLRIVESSTEQIGVALDSGSIVARVPGGEKTAFSVRAGPYQIVDLGTVFHVAWSPQKMTLSVRVTEGEVSITGPELGVHGVRLAAVNSFTIGPDGEIGIDESVEKTPTKISSSVVQPVETTPSVLRPGRRDPQRSGTTKNKDVPPRENAAGEEMPVKKPTEDWLIALENGHHQRALDAARRVGLESIALTSSENQLWNLAQASRFVRDGQAAVILLKTYRRRFAKTPEARTTAFLIGRVEMELNSDLANATIWFERYQSESPRGELVE